jgi:hypothetical protein
LSLNGQLGSIMMRSMVINMNYEQVHTLAQMQAFLEGTVALDFGVAAEERYGFIARTVRRFGYRGLKRPEKAVVLRFLERVSGYSRQQVARLVKRGGERGQLIKHYRGSRTSFARTCTCTYTSADVLLLAHTDSLHGTLSGLATKKLMERAFELFKEVRYERLAGISVGHLYNLRRREGYQRQRQVWTKTRPVNFAIGERRVPAPNNRPGHLRVDSVHQGDQDGVKSVYHINTVDCVTQYEGVATVVVITESPTAVESLPAVAGLECRLRHRLSPLVRRLESGSAVAGYDPPSAVARIAAAGIVVVVESPAAVAGIAAVGITAAGIVVVVVESPAAAVAGITAAGITAVGGWSAIAPTLESQRCRIIRKQPQVTEWVLP